MSSQPSELIFKEVEKQIIDAGFSIVSRDENRPWGGFFVLDESNAPDFAKKYFDGIGIDTLKIAGKLSPKILMVAPHCRLSWQYHHRRAEIWKVLQGIVGVIKSDTDIEGPLVKHNPGDLITLKQGERHRLVGLEEWGVVAEIWQHTDAAHPSDEDDIVRVQDDFGR